jgi:phasin family protein
MSDFQGQAAAAHRTNLDFCFEVADKVFEGEENLARLNLDTTKAMLSDWYQRAQDGLTKPEGENISRLQNALAPPSSETVLTYQRQFVEIASTLQTQLAEVIDTQYQQTSRQFQRLVENVGQNAPVSSEAAIAFLKQLITLANATHDSVRKATKQTIEFAQSSVSATTEAASQTTALASSSVEKPEKVAKH